MPPPVTRYSRSAMFTRSILSVADPPGVTLTPRAAEAEAVLGELVPVAGDVEEDGLAHQPRLVEGDDAVAVGDETDAVDGLQLDQRDAAAGLRIDDGDGERLVGLGGDQSR